MRHSWKSITKMIVLNMNGAIMEIVQFISVSFDGNVKVMLTGLSPKCPKCSLLASRRPLFLLVVRHSGRKMTPSSVMKMGEISILG